MILKGIKHAGCTCCLHAINLNIGTQALDSEGYTADETAATDGHNHCFHIGQLVKNFQANAALTSHNQLVVIGMDEGHAGFFLYLYGTVMSFIIGTGNQLNLSAQAFGVFYLHNRSAIGHADNTFDAHFGRC